MGDWEGGFWELGARSLGKLGVCNYGLDRGMGQKVEKGCRKNGNRRG